MAGWLLAAGALMATSLSSAGSASTGAPARLAAVTTIEFGYVGPQTQYVTVPGGVYEADFRVIGGHGGGTGGSAEFVTGGDGAAVSGVLPVFPGQQLFVLVGGAGGNGNSGNAGAGGWGATGDGGGGGGGSGLFGRAGAGGGGSSSLGALPHTYVVAGGGGGGGGSGFTYPADEGGPGGSSGTDADPGHNGSGPGAGSGGQGGANSNGSGSGTPGGGGRHSAGGGGGGGAGWLGGTGGSGGGFGAGGGGGGGAGSSYWSTLVRDGAAVRGTTPDGNGQVFITWATSGGGVGSQPGQDVTISPYQAPHEDLTGPASAGEAVELSAASGSPAQVWTLPSPGNPSVTQIINVQSGLCLDAASLSSGAQVIAATCNSSASQQWVQGGQVNGSYRILNDATRSQPHYLVLTPSVGSADVVLAPLMSGAEQDWIESAAP